MDYIVFLESCNGVMTWIFSDDFTDGMTEGLKPRSPYSDVALSPADYTDKHVLLGIPSVKVNKYPCSDTLFLYFSFFFPIPPLPSQTVANHPSQLSPSSQHQHSSFLYFCTWSQHPFLWILSFFISKSILFSFNI